uniref:polyphosphate polymerase domain-containing protein n=1 Tax=Flavobacterium sp. TaxID=239 RepID=UPI00404A96B7
MFEDFKQNIESLSPVSLKELDSVSLLNRIDSKFTLTEDELNKTIPCLMEHYHVLEIDGQRIFTYENNYFDTPNLLFYQDHHNGYASRIKVRSRRYVESNLCFFEIKKKEKVSRTNKFRERLPQILSEINDERKEVIQSYTRKKISALKLILKNDFTRITLVNKEFTERVTIDLNLNFQDKNQEIKLEHLAIVEVKQSKSSNVSPISVYFKENTIRQQSISKYIFGVISLMPSIKKNNFLPIIKKINNLS